MHGGSGLSHEDYKNAINAGINKLNYYTYMAYEGYAAAKELIEKEEKGPYHNISALLKWHRDCLSSYQKEEFEKQGINYYQYYSTRPIQLPTSLLVLPHFNGSGTPLLDASSSGAIIGLSLQTTKEEIYYALMEGASFEMRYNIDLLSKGGIKIDKLSANGGGSKSPSFLEIKANIYKKNIRTLTSLEGGIFGCFLLGMANLLNSLKHLLECLCIYQLLDN